MEDGMVTVFASMAIVGVMFAIILGYGKKYNDEDQKSN